MAPPDLLPQTGRAVTLEPGLVRVLAPNPSAMTLHGTNSYILGTTSLAVIDPGPVSDDHLAALLAAIAGRPVSHIFVTHSHLDHAPLAGPLAAATGASVVAFGDSHAGRSAVMQDLAKQGMTGGGEGMDWRFAPDLCLGDGESLHGDGWVLGALHTPGHLGNHLCLTWKDAIFSGDHVMGWSTSLVSPPDGDMTDFMASCRKLLGYPARVYYPGHGAPIAAPLDRVAELIRHRTRRENDIITALRKTGPCGLLALTDLVYSDIPMALVPAASRNVFAHLVDLSQRQKIGCTPQLCVDAEFFVPQGAL